MPEGVTGQSLAGLLDLDMQSIRKLNAEWDLDRLAIEIAELRASDFDISLIGFSESEIDDLLKADEDGAGPGAGSMAERFMLPPFSVLNARGGWWQERKAAWLSQAAG